MTIFLTTSLSFYISPSPTTWYYSTVTSSFLIQIVPHLRDDHLPLAETHNIMFCFAVMFWPSYRKEYSTLLPGTAGKIVCWLAHVYGCDYFCSASILMDVELDVLIIDNYSTPN